MSTLTSLRIMLTNSLLESFPGNQRLYTLKKLLPPRFSLLVVVFQLGKDLLFHNIPLIHIVGALWHNIGSCSEIP